MSLFEWNEQEQQDYENWMANVKEQIKENVFYKALAWSFNFESGQARDRERFRWEETKNPCQRLSHNMRSTISTLPTLGEDEELLENIPSISELDLRISVELAKSPIVLLPHRSSSHSTQIKAIVQGSQNDDKCVVCLKVFEEAENVQDNPCGHKFHLACVENWRKTVPECYFCRTQFVGK